MSAPLTMKETNLTQTTVTAYFSSKQLLLFAVRRTVDSDDGQYGHE